MQANAHSRRLPCVATLRHQCSNHACHQIAHTTGTHAGISPDTDFQTSIRIGNQTTRAFQYDNCAVTLRQRTCSSEAIFLNVCRRRRKQSRGLTGVRCHYGRCAELSRLACKQIESVGIKYQWLVAIERRQPQCVPPCRLAQPGPHRQNGGAIEQRLQFLGAVYRVRHQFRPCRIQCKKIIGARGDTHQSCTAA